MADRQRTSWLIFMALSVAINFIGCTLALLLRLPVYLDSVGTLLTGVLLGPMYGAVVGVITGLINGITVDPVSLYFIPVQLITGLLAGLFFSRTHRSRVYTVAMVLLTGVIISLVSAVIVTMVFDGVTSSGSSLIVAALSNLGVHKVLSVLSTQIVTDLLDKSLSFALIFAAIRTIPATYRQKLR